jgi:hypothetical protein
VKVWWHRSGGCSAASRRNPGVEILFVSEHAFRHTANLLYKMRLQALKQREVVQKKQSATDPISGADITAAPPSLKPKNLIEKV